MKDILVIVPFPMSEENLAARQSQTEAVDLSDQLRFTFKSTKAAPRNYVSQADMVLADAGILEVGQSAEDEGFAALEQAPGAAPADDAADEEDFGDFDAAPSEPSGATPDPFDAFDDLGAPAAPASDAGAATEQPQRRVQAHTERPERARAALEYGGGGGRRRRGGVRSEGVVTSSSYFN